MVRRAAKILSRYPALYSFLVRTISKVPVFKSYFIESSDNFAHKFPVSVKGVIIRDERVALLKNERDEWELPGGKLEPGETPEACVVREIYEELKLEVKASTLLGVWLYAPTKGTSVLMVTFGCFETVAEAAKISGEHQEFAWIPLSEVANLTMPEGYKHSIYTWSSDPTIKSSSGIDTY
jgi:8-oxo-dGTP pyrophosphatase MutT (NUDIX family)